MRVRTSVQEGLVKKPDHGCAFTQVMPRLGRCQRPCCIRLVQVPYTMKYRTTLPNSGSVRKRLIVGPRLQCGLHDWQSCRRLLALVTPHIPAAARIAGEKLHAVYNGGLQAFQAFMHQPWLSAVLRHWCRKYG